MAERDDEHERESRRILERMQRESDPSGSLAARTARRARRHIEATDADQRDPIEVWGTRIGRILGIAVFIVLVVWLVRILFSGSS